MIIDRDRLTQSIAYHMDLPPSHKNVWVIASLAESHFLNGYDTYTISDELTRGREPIRLYRPGFIAREVVTID